MGFEDDLMNAVKKTKLTHCSVDSNTADVSVFFSDKEMKELGEGGVMVFIPRRMEGLIKEEAGKDLFLPDDFFENMEYEEVEGGNVYSYEGKVRSEKRDDGPVYEAMDDLDVRRPMEE